MTKKLFPLKLEIPLKMGMMKIYASFPHGMDAPAVRMGYFTLSNQSTSPWSDAENRL